MYPRPKKSYKLYTINTKVCKAYKTQCNNLYIDKNAMQFPIQKQSRENA